MNLDEVLEIMKNIQMNLIDFLDDKNDEESFVCLRLSLEDIIIQNNKYELISLLHLIANISKNHYRGPFFYNKIEKILQYLKKSMQNHFSNQELISIFKSNKRILLYLIEQNLITVDQYFVEKFTENKYKKMKYVDYFLPEIKSFIDKHSIIFPNIILNGKIPENFYELRKKGENEAVICEMIRNDSIIEFTAYVTKHNYPLDANISVSIYESNSYLLKKQAGLLKNKSIFFGTPMNNEDVSLIEYAAFFGSIEIFQYLRFNNVQMPQSLWPLAIHGKNAEIIHLIEFENILPESLSYERCFKESIKCHHNDIVDFLKINYLSVFIDNSIDTLRYSLKYHNYALIDINLINQNYFYELCQYDHPSFVKILFDIAYDKENKEAI